MSKEKDLTKLKPVLEDFGLKMFTGVGWTFRKLKPEKTAYIGFSLFEMGKNGVTIDAVMTTLGDAGFTLSKKFKGFGDNKKLMLNIGVVANVPEALKGIKMRPAGFMGISFGW